MEPDLKSEQEIPQPAAIHQWRLDIRRQIITHIGSLLVTVLAIPLFTAIALLLPTPWDYGIIERRRISTEQVTYILLGVLFLMLLTLVLHEAFHGLGFRIVGAKRRYGFKMAGSVPVFYATAPGFLMSKRQYLMVGLLPTFAVNLIGIAMMYPFTFLRIALILPLAVHLGGCIVDWMMAFSIWKLPDSARFEDNEDGFRYSV